MNPNPDPHGVWTLSEYDVILEAVGTDRLGVMRVIRSHPRCRVSLEGVRDLIDRTPIAVIENANHRGEVYPLARALKATGSTVLVVHRFYEIAAACYGPDVEPIRLSDTVTREVPVDEWDGGERG